MPYFIDPHGGIRSYLKVMLLLLSLTGNRESRMVLRLLFLVSKCHNVIIMQHRPQRRGSIWIPIRMHGDRSLAATPPLCLLVPAVNRLSFSLAHWNLPLKHPLSVFSMLYYSPTGGKICAAPPRFKCLCLKDSFSWIMWLCSGRSFVI